MCSCVCVRGIQILEREQTLLFHLHQQQLIELIRDNKVPEALEFATDYLAPAGEENTQLLDDLGETLFLVCVCVRVCVCERARARVCVCVCVCVCN